MRIKLQAAPVTLILALFVLFVLSGVAVAQTLLPAIRLNGGESVTVECTSGRNLAVERSPDRKAALLTCRGQGQPNPTETPETPAPTATTQPPTPTPAPQPTAPAGSVAPVDPASMLGTCSAETHDRYVVTGPDGKLYRTWHPQIDPSGCVYAHEHGDDPTTSRADNSLPPFGYVGGLMGMVEPHEGFKVFVAHRGERNDEARTAQVDSRIVAHFGTSRQGRFTNQFHSLEYDMIAPGGQFVHVQGMANTQAGGDICERDARSQGANPIGRTFYALPGTTACAANGPYEIWAFKLDLVRPDGDGALVMASVAAFEPATALNKTTGEAVPTGWLGCDREAYHGPVYWYQQGWSPVEFRTDAMGMRQADGPLVQQVSLHNAIGIPFSNDQTLFKLRTNYCAPGLALPN